MCDRIVRLRSCIALAYANVLNGVAVLLLCTVHSVAKEAADTILLPHSLVAHMMLIG